MLHTSKLQTVLKVQVPRSSPKAHRLFKLHLSCTQIRPLSVSRSFSTKRAICSHRPVLLTGPGYPFRPTSPRFCLDMAPEVASDRDVLPDNIKPINYDISLYDLELGGAFSYKGTVSILSKIFSSSREITLNTHQLEIHRQVIIFFSVSS